jgi:hypothetical protein
LVFRCGVGWSVDVWLCDVGWVVVLVAWSVVWAGVVVVVLCVGLVLVLCVGWRSCPSVLMWSGIVTVWWCWVTCPSV